MEKKHNNSIRLHIFVLEFMYVSVVGYL